MTTDSNRSSKIPPQHRVFATTSWSMVMQAAAEDSTVASDALAQLCEAYWYPLYAFARRKGNERAKAEDLTQAFFAELLEHKRLANADPVRGRFRNFLLTSFKNFIANVYRGETTQKRGGSQQILAFDFKSADEKYSLHPCSELTPDRIFERNWSLSILDATLNAVREQYKKSNKLDLFEALKEYLVGSEEAPYAEIADRLKMKTGAIRVAVHRIRERYGHQLRLQIARTVDDPDDVEDEIRNLFQALS